MGWWPHLIEIGFSNDFAGIRCSNSVGGMGSTWQGRYPVGPGIGEKYVNGKGLLDKPGASVAFGGDRGIYAFG